jgi:hypothetical protein
VPGVQVFVGTSSGSPVLPSILGTPIHSPTAANPSGVAARIDMNAFELDLGDLFGDLIPEVAGMVITMPDLSFVAPGSVLTAAGDGSTSDVVRIPMDLFGVDNSANPGNDLTTAPNPVQTGVQVGHSSVIVSDQTFLFDTGAQLSVISSEIAALLGIDLLSPFDSIEVQGAAGTASVDGYIIDSLSLPRDDNNDGIIDGTLRFTNVPVFVLDIVDGIDGILGMNLFNTAQSILYDPFGPGGASASFTFWTDPERGLDDDAAGALSLLQDLTGVFGGVLAGATIFSPQTAPLAASAGLPEPSSIVIWTVLGMLIAGAGRWRKRPRQ